MQNTTTQHNLTRREVQTLQFISMGYTSKEIATTLYISTETVGSHRKKILSKLGVNNMMGAVAHALRHKVIE